MRNIIIASSLCLLMVGAFAETYISGSLSGTLYRDLSPYFIIANVEIQPGDSLIVEDGVEIIFSGYYRLTVRADAVLKCRGTYTDSVRVTATNHTAGFNSIVFENASPACSLSYCAIEYGNINGFYPYIFGGAIMLNNTDATIRNCRISDSKAQYGCGGALGIYRSAPKVEFCKFENNFTVYNGGAIYIDSSAPEFLGCIFVNNVATLAGGAVALNFESRAEAKSCVFKGNVTNAEGGAVYLQNSHFASINNTIVENRAGSTGGAIYVDYGSHAEVFNSIVWGNTAADDKEISVTFYPGYACRLEAKFSDIRQEKITVATGSALVFDASNVAIEPAFCVSGCVRLSPECELVDGGTNEADFHDAGYVAPSIDVFGNPRPCGETFDIGACEFVPKPQLSLSDTIVNFGEIAVSASGSQQLIVENLGYAALELFSFTIENPVFSIEEFPASVLPHSAAALQINFSSEDTGLFLDSMIVATNADTQVVVLRAVAYRPASAQVEITSLVLDPTCVGRETNGFVNVRNIGGRVLNLTSVECTSPEFENTFSHSEINPGEDENIQISFVPTSAGEFSTILHIETNGGNYDIPVSVNVFAAPSIYISSSNVDFGEIAVGTTSSMNIQIANYGGFILPIDEIVLPEGVFTVSHDELPELIAGETFSINVSFNPTETGTFSNVIEIRTPYGNREIAISGSAFLGIAENSSNKPTNFDVQTYPNPFNSSITIEFQNQTKDALIEIFDVNGKLVQRFESDKVVWNSSNIETGTYFVRATSSGNVETKKIECIK